MGTIWQPDLDHYDGPKYRRVTDALRDAIREGVFEVGEKLPPVRDLAWRLGITPGTVARAYTILTDEGALDAAVGRGTFVAPTHAAAVPPPVEIDSLPHGSADKDGPISLFSPVIPNVGQSRLIKALLAEVAQDPPSGVMHYPSRKAFRPARVAAVSWLKDSGLGALDESDIVLCHGGQNGMSLVMQAVLRGATPTVYVEEVSYPGIMRAADLLRARVVPVSMDGQGIVPEALRAATIQYGPGLLCTSPEVHNPTGLFTPEARRREIVDVCRQQELHILDDDCYRMGPSRAVSYRMLAPERAWYVSSISKVLTPSLRLGFAIAPKDRAGDLRRAADHGFFGLATPMGDLAQKLLSHPQIHDIAAHVRQRFAQYIKIALNHLGGYDVDWQQDVPFLWLRLPRGWRASSFCLAAEARGVGIRPAEEFVPRDAHAPHAVRIAINAGISPDRFEQAVAELRDLLDNPPENIGV